MIFAVSVPRFQIFPALRVLNQEIYHLEALFEGHVQGVGFRFTTRQIASGFEVTGYVQNLPDGRVRLEAEGAEGEVKAFLRELKKELGSYIRKSEEHESAGARRFEGFGIRH